MNYKNYITYAKELLYLAFPIIMGYIGFVMIMAGDVLIAAKYSTDVLAAVGISSSVTSIIFMFGIGLLGSVSAILSNKLGAKKSAKTFLIPTIKFSMLLALLTTVSIILIIPLFEKLGYEAKLIPLIKAYTLIFAFSTFGDYLYKAFREFLQAYEIVFIPNLIAIIGIFLNIFLNWVLAFGVGPIPELGIKGLAIASVTIRTFMGLSILGYYLYKFKIKQSSLKFSNYYQSLIKIGLPMSFAVCIEFLAFNSMIIIMGKVSGVYAAAQNIINVIASTTFMIPLAISTAITIKVGFSNGAKNLSDVKRYSIIGCLLSVCFMACCGVFIAVYAKQLSQLFTNDLTLINIIIPIMTVVACFQVSDGLQVSLGGIYKGLKKTNIVMISNFFGYLVIGVPLGTFLALKLHLNLFGFWLGIGIASSLLAVILASNLVKTFKTLNFEFSEKTPQGDLSLIK